LLATAFDTRDGACPLGAAGFGLTLAATVRAATRPIPVYDRHTGAAWQAPLFVAARGANFYTWAEATRDQQMEAWLGCHVHAFEHFHGIPALAVPDNTKTGVTKAHRYDPEVGPLCERDPARRRACEPKSVAGTSFG
jgi:transposase